MLGNAVFLLGIQFMLGELGYAWGVVCLFGELDVCLRIGCLAANRCGELGAAWDGMPA